MGTAESTCPLKRQVKRNSWRNFYKRTKSLATLIIQVASSPLSTGIKNAMRYLYKP